MGTTANKVISTRLIDETVQQRRVRAGDDLLAESFVAHASAQL